MSALAEPSSGEAIDGFRIGGCLHAGAMGRLYEVTRPGAAFPMVMKVPRLGAADSAELMLAFETEAMILPRLSGPHVPRFVAAGDVTTVPYIVLERVPGESLDRGARGPQPGERVARLGAAIADALHSIHGQDAVHLDLKPDNVVLRPDGVAVLVDFALSHHRDLPDLLAEERRFAAGTAPYVSPEQVLGTRSDRRSDLFALGVLLYEMATGELPFGAPATDGGLRDRIWRVPRPPVAIRADIPPWLQEVILRCLEPELERRYQSAAHVAFDLRHPEKVPLTARASRRQAEGALAQAARWWRSREMGLPARRPEQAHAPVIMVAVDTRHLDDPRQPALQWTTRRILSLNDEFRLICVSVVPAGPALDAAGEDAQVEHRIRLRHWLQPVGVPPQRVSMHVLEAGDAAAALVDFAHSNNVDLIVLGAPSPDERTLAWWRSVASSVTAHAGCSVHVVRR